jgi:hypothetical protein
MGFGKSIAIISLGFASASVIFFAWSRRHASLSLAALVQFLPKAQRVMGSLVVLWTLPSLLQPMDALLNVGDSTEKVLDEIAGWATGNIPGANTSWVHGAFLGIPMLPLNLIEGHGDWKIVVIMLYVNGLVVAVPVVMALIISKCLPKLELVIALAISMTAVTISGDPRNTSLFQELSFLARGFMPVLLGFVTLVLFGNVAVNGRPRSRGLVLLGLLASITALNNYEYGGGAALTVLGISALVAPPDQSRVRQFAIASSGFLSGLIAASAYGAFFGGNWIARRLGAWYDVVIGEASQHSNSGGSSIPTLGVPALYFALSLSVLAYVLHSPRKVWTVSSISGLYFSLWSLLSAPYFLNGGGQGAFRTQFLLIPVLLLVVSVAGMMQDSVEPSVGFQSQIEDVSQQGWRDLTRFEPFSMMPLALLAALSVASVVQTPNSLLELRRVQTSEPGYRNLDEWSPERLDWISPEGVRQLAEQYGGAANVGWWFSYGNAIELLTGVENLLGVSGWETMRSNSQSALGCQPILSTDKPYVISIKGAESMLAKCRGLVARPITSPNEDQLVVYSIKSD